MDRSTRFLLLIRSLHQGGAERQVFVLAKGLNRMGFKVHVAVFYPGGPFEKDLAEAGIPVTSLGKRGRWDLLHFGWRLVQLVRRTRPHYLFSFLPSANLAALAVKPFLQGGRLVWGIRASNMDLCRYERAARVEFRLQCLLSRCVDLAIANSRRGLEFHRTQGFPARRLRFVPNGIDTGRFLAVSAWREKVRREWGVREDEVLIGMVARLDPMKGHEVFLRAAAQLAETRPEVRFVCVGSGRTPVGDQLRDLARALGLEGKVLWAGSREDMAAVFGAMDILTSASIFGEGFSNAIGEAMACGTLCVVTDVGDSCDIVGHTGVTVPPGDPEALAAGWTTMLERLRENRQELSKAARARIVDYFDEEQLPRRTIAALVEVG